MTGTDLHPTAETTVQPAPPAVDALVDAWQQALVTGSTRDAYRRDVDAFAAWLEGQGKDLLQADRRDLDAWRDHLRADHADTTVARALSSLSSLYSFVSGEAADRGWTFADPSERVQRPKTSSPYGVTPRLGKTGRTALLRAARASSQRDWVLVRLLLCAGLRASETLAADAADLEWYEDDDGQRWRRLWVDRKGGVKEAATLDHSTSQAVDQLLDGRVTGPILQTSNGKPLHRSYAWRMLRRLARDAGLEDAQVSPHVLRVESITWALDSGATLRETQDFAGHRDPRTTRRYDRGRNAPERSPVHVLGAKADASL